MPKGFSLESYKALLNDSRTILYYWNTIQYAAVGTVIMLLTTSLMAYPLSIPSMRGRKLVSILLTITMFFGGGLIPYYVTIMQLGMIDSFWVMVIPGAISAYNVIVFKTFFMSIPEALSESAFLDGAGHFRVLFQIVLPLSKAVIAVITLFYAVGHWNAYFGAFIYLSDRSLHPLQLVLREILIANSFDTRATGSLANSAVEQQRLRDLVKYCVMVVSTLPVICIYPFIQKYFESGVTIGAVKG